MAKTATMLSGAPWLIVFALYPVWATGQILPVPGSAATTGAAAVDAEQSVLAALYNTEYASDWSSEVWVSDELLQPMATGCPHCHDWHAWGGSCGCGAWCDFMARPHLLFGPGPTLLRHSDFYPRHVGLGQPLTDTSWLNRPYHAGWFMGTMFGDEVIKNRVDQGSDFFGGYRLGWDFDHYWGTELRFGFAELNLQDSSENRLADTDDVFLADVSLLYYPWGDSRWRPYLLAGVGFGHFHFDDELGRGQDGTLLGLPVGGGLKYQYRRWLALRLEVLDNIALANQGLATMHNISLTLGVEVHHGTRRRSYWPWHPGRHLW